MPDVSSVTILLVEDDPGHARLIERNLRRAHMAYTVTVFHNGQEAVDYLCQEPAAHVVWPPTPLVVLLDLNLPGLDGYQVLTRLKTHTRTSHIPVLILSTTDEPCEIERCYALGCNVYITKPVEYAQFVDTIHTLGLFLTIVQIPHGA